jgi:prepilin-type N-terminal cleavage/methylation domain-containing protein
MRNRRGFTLIELLVALILLIIVGGGLYQVLITVQRVSQKQAAVSSLQGNLRAGMQLIQGELQEIATNATASPATSDITAMTSTLLTYNAMRGVGETCEVSATLVKVRKSSYSGRDPVATRDALRLYTDADTTLITDDTWPSYAISGVNGAAACPDGAAAWGLTVTTIPTPTNVWVPGPIRTYETMQIGLVNDAGQDWLGIRSISGSEATLVPVVGPLTSTGLNFAYFAADGSVTATTTAVKAIRITLFGITDRTVATGLGSARGIPRDTLMFQVQLRNSR